ncbi:NAD-dependent epimerase/dehydratase family protein [Plantibacter sp. YIM 135347]|uniref:NAD-dependent epimerase/dehydratase family protein n=1 Tax=Plantibacter sp. YIM 135347 TaxID=3423919 RepID=UPI003D358C04
MTTQLVLGAGLIGTGLVERLVARGDRVVVATRSGTKLPGATAVSLDASDDIAIAAAAEGAQTIFACVNPPYGKWATLWPPVFAAVTEAAKRSGASLVTMGNLYPYGRAAMPMTEHSPEHPADRKGAIREAGWALAKAANDRGDIRAVEVRASDYFGPGSGPTAHLGGRFFEPLLTGGTARVVGNPALAHSWAYLPDITATLVAAADHPGEWGRVWHVPPASDLSRTAVADRLREQYGATGRLSLYPGALLAAIGLFVPDIREVHRSSYQFTAPFVNTADETVRELGVQPTPWDEALETTVESYR